MYETETSMHFLVTQSNTVSKSIRQMGSTVSSNIKVKFIKVFGGKISSISKKKITKYKELCSYVDCRATFFCTILLIFRPHCRCAGDYYPLVFFLHFRMLLRSKVFKVRATISAPSTIYIAQ